MGQLLFKDDQSLFVSARYVTHIIDGWNGQLGDQIAEIQKVTTNTAYGNRSEATIQRQYEQYLDVWNNRIKPALTSEKLYASDTFELRRRLVGIQSEYVAAVTKASKSFVKFSEAVNKNEPKMAELVSETEAIYLKMFDIDLTIIIDSASNKRNRVLQQLPEQPVLYFWGNVLRGDGWTYNAIFKTLEPQLKQHTQQTISGMFQHANVFDRFKDPKQLPKLIDMLMAGSALSQSYDDAYRNAMSERVIPVVEAQIDQMLINNDATEELKKIAQTKLLEKLVDAELKKVRSWLRKNLPEMIQTSIQERTF